LHCSSRPLTLSATYIRDLAQDGNAAIIGYDSGTAPKVIDLTSAAVTSISNPAANTLGIAITPDGNTLFLGDAHVGKIWRVV